MKKGIIMTLFAVIFHTADTLAQMPAWLSNVKLSGYGMPYRHAG